MCVVRNFLKFHYVHCKCIFSKKLLYIMNISLKHIINVKYGPAEN